MIELVGNVARSLIITEGLSDDNSALQLKHNGMTMQVSTAWHLNDLFAW